MSQSTSTLKTIVNSRDSVKKNIIWIVRNGHDIKFWKDTWILGCGALVNTLGAHCPIEEIDFLAFHYVLNGSWNWNNINQHVLTDICVRIAAVMPPAPGALGFPCWKLTSDGLFSLKTTYDVLRNQQNDPVSPNPLFEKVWN